MKKTKIITLLIIVVAISFNACKSYVTSKKNVTATKPKNILFIAVDDLKPILGCYGETVVKTPNIDKLAAQGFILANNHCQQAVCGPSRASILTGKRPDYTKIWDLQTLIRDKNPNIVTMPQYFKQNGYQTVAVGKIFDPRSVDKGHDSISWTYPYDNVKQKRKEYVKATGKPPYEIIDSPDSLTVDGEVASNTIKYLRKFAKEDKPFFMATGFHKPHLPFVAPRKYFDLYNINDIKLPAYQKDPVGAPAFATQPSWELRSGYDDIPKDYSVDIPVETQKKLIQGYYACTTFIDQQIGNVIDELDRLGLRENTIIVLWGDHGWHLGDHNMYCKHTNFEQSTHAPLIFSAGKNQIGKSNSPTEFVDVYPTLCELAGIETPKNLEGVSLVPLMEKKVSKVKDYAVSQFPRENDKMGYTFRNEKYRYTVWLTKNYTSESPFNTSLIVGEELYDYEKDPEERKNLINEADYQTIKADLKAKAITFFKSKEVK